MAIIQLLRYFELILNLEHFAVLLISPLFSRWADLANPSFKQGFVIF